VDPTDGGRIVEFSLDGRSVVVPRDESPVAYGSSLWPSPQKAWTWPPPLELDLHAWKVETDGNALVLQSGVSEKLGLSARQRISVQADGRGVVLEVALQNRGIAPLEVAAWRNTRVRPGGLTFFPSKSSTLPQSELTLEPLEGVIWYRHDPTAQRDNAKIFADGDEGWLAHVDGDLLFVQRFDDVPRAKMAPGEAEIEIYVDGSGGFVEVEAQGPYESIAPGAETSWTQSWSLQRLPEGILAEAGSTELVAVARERR
jgi:hypothetical protein